MDRASNTHEAPLTHCPSCAYSLKSLPVIGTCPECGFDYDPSARVIPLNPGRHPLRQAVIGAVLLAGGLYYGIWRLPSKGIELSFVLALGALVLAYFFTWTLRASESARLLITRHGVRFDAPRLDRGWIPWSRMGHARYLSLLGRLLIYDAKGETIDNLPFRKLGSPATARFCAAVINGAVQRYSKDGTRDLDRGASRPRRRAAE